MDAFAKKFQEGRELAMYSGLEIVPNVGSGEVSERLQYTKESFQKFLTDKIKEVGPLQTLRELAKVVNQEALKIVVGYSAGWISEIYRPLYVSEGGSGEVGVWNFPQLNQEMRDTLYTNEFVYVNHYGEDCIYDPADVEELLKRDDPNDIRGHVKKLGEEDWKLLWFWMCEF